MCRVCASLSPSLPRGYFAKCGYDVAPARDVVRVLQPLLALARSRGLTVMHTREGHRPTLSDLPRYKRERSAFAGAAIGSEGPMGQGGVRSGPSVLL